MDMYAEILAAALQYGKLEISFPDNTNMQDIVEGHCYAALHKIKHILSDPTLDDPECFQKIEEIVHTLETFGIDSGGRHDFG